MADRANVTSVDAIESFRANLIAYLGKTRPVLEEACDEVFRTRQWLQYDRRVHWENQLKRRRKILEEAEQTLFGARIGNLREATSAEMAAVTRAKRALTEAEEKLRLVKRWTSEFDHRVQPLVKELEGLRTMMANDMPKAAAHLAQIIRTLDAYAGVKPAGSLSAAPVSESKPDEAVGNENTSAATQSETP
jgi:hypothetical protein